MIQVLLAIWVLGVSLAATAEAETMGSFVVMIDQPDPFADSDAFVAITAQTGPPFGIRCLDNDVTAVTVVNIKANPGEEVALKVRIDKRELLDIDGQVIHNDETGSIVQFGDSGFVKALRRSKIIAVRATLNGITSTTEIEHRGVDEVVDRVLRACRVK